jgi:ssRNA-specific RNase YbeY (16S rRNA maturation enzyme)
MSVNIDYFDFVCDPLGLKETVEDTLKKYQKIDADINVAVVDDKVMDTLSIDKMRHPVFAFCNNEISGKFVFPPNRKNYLGDIVVNYSYVVEQAVKEGKLVDDVLNFWVKHATLHLLGVHHE